MPEEQFDKNFMWYEWSFVSPGDVPSDDLPGTPWVSQASESPDVGAYGMAPRPETPGGYPTSKPIPVVRNGQWTV